MGGANRREELLDVAMAMFAERGIAATSLADIAAKVQVTPAMMHYYFNSRDLLLDAIVDERLAVSIASVWGPVDPAEKDPVRLIGGVAMRIAEAADRMRSIPVLWVREVLSEGGLLRERVLKRIPTEKLKHISMCIAAARRAGLIDKRIDPGFTLFSILGLAMIPLASMSLWETFPGVQKLDRRKFAPHLAALIANGLGVPRQGNESEAEAQS
jgi:AcrR family transcriptional regulator